MAINKQELAKRLGFGAVYVGITSACTILSWESTVAVMSVTAALCCYEFLRMAKVDGQQTYIVIGTVASALMPIAVALGSLTGHAIAGALAVAFAAAVIMLSRYLVSPQDTINDVALTLFGYLYTGMMLSSFVLLRARIPGLEGGILCFFVLGSVWINDGFAYLGGSAFGKHKFAPHISPKKSWEGVIIGTVFSTAWWLLVPIVAPSCGFGFVWAALAGVCCGVVGVLGDLTESHIKRGFDAKDSGNLMPGHGGLLDRSDSFIFVSVVAYAFVAIAPFVFRITGVFL